MAQQSFPPSALGFLTVVDQPELGLVGGFLILNLAGRPLEFHCTAPVRANRAQQILYGPTLEPFLYGEQIGHALIGKSEAPVLLVATDHPAVLAVRTLIDTPLALLPADNANQLSGGASDPFEVAGWTLAVSPKYPRDRDEIQKRLSDVGTLFDLREPFDRIREAIREAQREALARIAQPAAA